MRDKKTGLVDDLNDLKAFAEAMRPGELTVISGASGVGKTTLALRIAQALVGPDDAAETEASKRVLVFTPKHRSEFFVQKGLCRRRIYIDDYDRLDVTGIDCRTRAMHRVFGVDLLIVDSVPSLRENSGSDTPVSDRKFVGKGLRRDGGIDFKVLHVVLTPSLRGKKTNHWVMTGYDINPEAAGYRK